MAADLAEEGSMEGGAGEKERAAYKTDIKNHNDEKMIYSA